MLTLKQMTADSPDLDVMRCINTEAFPENERVPMDAFFSLRELDVNVLGVYRDADPVGFLVLMQKAPCVYINYFAIAASCRSQGLGGQVLQLLPQVYPHMQIVADFESVDAPGDNLDQRTHRRAFYLRSGFKPTGMYMYYMETEFEVTYCGAGAFDQTAFLALLQDLHNSVPGFAPRIYHKPLRDA